MRKGGGWMGIHAAADCEYNWPWYNKLCGGWFKSHPKQQQAKLMVVDKTHISTKAPARCVGALGRMVQLQRPEPRCTCID